MIDVPPDVPQASDVPSDWLSLLVGTLSATGGFENANGAVEAAEALGQHGRIATLIMPKVCVPV